jgi:hypothetical protein
MAFCGRVGKLALLKRMGVQWRVWGIGDFAYQVLGVAAQVNQMGGAGDSSGYPRQKEIARQRSPRKERR